MKQSLFEILKKTEQKQTNNSGSNQVEETFMYLVTLFVTLFLLYSFSSDLSTKVIMFSIFVPLTIIWLTVKPEASK